MSALPIPMLARPLDMVSGPPDPTTRYTGPERDDGRVPIWLNPCGRWDVSTMVLNPGDPGEPEPLPWKRDDWTRDAEAES